MRQVSHDYLPHGHYAEAAGVDRQEAIANALGPLPLDGGYRAERVRLLGKVGRSGRAWWAVRYTCAKCPARRKERA